MSKGISVVERSYKLVTKAGDEGIRFSRTLKRKRNKRPNDFMYHSIRINKKILDKAGLKYGDRVDLIFYPEEKEFIIKKVEVGYKLVQIKNREAARVEMKRISELQLPGMAYSEFPKFRIIKEQNEIIVNYPKGSVEHE